MKRFYDLRFMIDDWSGSERLEWLPKVISDKGRANLPVSRDARQASLPFRKLLLANGINRKS
jgi:hypothetical protein